MNVKDDGRCAFTPGEGKRCPKKTDARYVLTLIGARGELEAMLPFGACSEHAEIPGHMVMADDQSDFCRLPGVMHAIEAYRERYKADPQNATVAVVGVDTDAYKELVRMARASGKSGASVPIVVESARAKDVKEAMGEDAFNRAFGSGPAGRQGSA